MYLIRYLENYHIIRVAFFGTFSGVNDTTPMMKKLVAAVEEYDCPRIFFDMRNTRIAAGAIELHHLGINAAIFGFKREYKVAVLFSGDEKKHRLVEQVMNDRSYQFQVFENENAALIWLNRQAAADQHK